MTSDTRRSRD